MSRGTQRVALGIAAVALFGCSDDSVDITVDLITDWRPGLDFISVQTEVSTQPLETGSAAEVRQESYTVTGGETFFEGERVAELDEVGLGRRFVRVQLRDAGGRTIASRLLDLTLERSFAATLLITRSCRDVECPAPAGAPELSECQGGECVDPRCSPSTPEFCPGPACGNDGDCAMLIDWCDGVRVCGVSGHCLCDDLMPVVDAGPDTRPTEIVCDDGLDGDGDGQTDCADADCMGSACDDGFFCTMNETCGADLACSVTEPTCPTFCNETTSSCDECMGGGDCGLVTMGDWSACAGFANACDTTGTNMRSVMTPSCSAGMCTVNTTTEMGTCTRPTDGVACNDGNPCTGPDRCSGGSCSDTPAMAEHSMCGSANLRCCGGSCVDIRTSTSHCGGCGLRCNAGFACMSRGGLPTCDCNTLNSDCSGSTNHCSGMSSLCSCDPAFGGVCPSPMTCHVMTLGADVCTY